MGRTGEYINDGWHFRKCSGAQPAKLAAPALDDSGWQEVTLPHTWNSSDCTGRADSAPEYSEGYYRGAGCYRRKVFLSNAQYRGREVFIEFGGANTVTELYVNGKKAGRHEGGYSAFRFDITKYVRTGTENLFAVVVSNASSDYIAPICDCGDFTKMGGIYRPVRLVSACRVHLGDFRPRAEVLDGAARVTAEFQLENNGAANACVSVKAEVYGGDTSVSSQGEYTAARGETRTGAIEITLPDPHLWDGVRDPFLYTMKVSVMVDGECVDSLSKQFGVRTFAFDREKGFFLNGKPTPLHGVNYHQDCPKNGWAMSQKQRERDYAMMRDMGCNAVRMAHYQHCEEEYALCDRLGLCVPGRACGARGFRRIPQERPEPAARAYRADEQPPVRNNVRNVQRNISDVRQHMGAVLRNGADDKQPPRQARRRVRRRAVLGEIPRAPRRRGGI